MYISVHTHIYIYMCICIYTNMSTGAQLNETVQTVCLDEYNRVQKNVEVSTSDDRQKVKRQRQ